MFGLPTIYNLWTSEQTPLSFVELLGRRNGHSKREYVIVAVLSSGYAVPTGI